MSSGRFMWLPAAPIAANAAVFAQNIPLQLLNRKFIKDINELYGFYQAGASLDGRPPLMDYRMDDPEPSVIYTRGGTAK